jgi:uncharacterized lipoprotein YmbA
MRPVVLLILLMSIAGCSGSKKLGKQEVQSQFTKASSAAAETLTFVEYIRQGSPTKNFVRGHAENLRRQIEQQAEELSKAQAEPDNAAQLEQCRRDLHELQTQVNRIDPSLSQDAIAEITSRVEKIRADLQNGKPQP